MISWIAMEPVDILKKRDLLSYTDMIDQIERGIGKVFYCGMDGIVTMIDDYYACIAPFDSDVRPFIELLPRSVDLVTVHRENLRGMMREYGFRMSNPCSTYVYTKDEDVPVRAQDIRVLDASYAPAAYTVRWRRGVVSKGNKEIRRRN
ncbi:MAG: hypothetical protein ACI4NM_09235 [Bullifex sp.]